jgi:hypothetical protein
VKLGSGGALCVAALAAVVLGGCAFNTSPAQALQFRPPPDWRSSPGFLGFMQFWRPPVDDREVLMLFKSPRQLQPSQVFADTRLQGDVRDTKIERRSTIRICGTQPAEYVEARGTSSRGEARMEMVVTNVGGSTYFAMYARPVELPANPMAEAALRELCAKT